MKPRTKRQVKVFELSQTLPIITEDQKHWAFKNMLQHVGYRTKKAIGCLDCGHVWVGPQKVKSCTCPACGTKIKIEDTLKRKLHQSKKYLSVLDVKDGFQIVRIFEVYSNHKVGQKPELHIWEVIQQFISTDGKIEIVARNRTVNFYMDNFNGYLENRKVSDWRNKYDLWTDRTYPKKNVLPIYVRNGFKGKIEGVSHYQIFKNILTDSISETLLKAKQFGLLEVRISSRRNEIYKYWNSIKICIRAKYVIKFDDVITWLDYLNLLSYFGKDLLNAKYVCPQNLKKAHDTYVAKKNEAEKRIKLEQQRLKIDSDQKEYTEAKGAYFGLVFRHKDLTIKLIDSVRQFFDEGQAHKHCVYTNEYYKKEDSLIFSAHINSQPIETIEVSLSEMRIIQSRGFGNMASKYNERIIDLLNRNLAVIRTKYMELKKEVA
jgi:hypothetical protein